MKVTMNIAQSATRPSASSPVARLSLLGHHLQITADVAEVIADVVGRLVPPCDPGGLDDAGWTINVRLDPCGLPDLGDLSDRPQLVIRRDGPRLALRDVAGGRIAAVGQYAPGGAPVRIESDLEQRLTYVWLHADDTAGRRWVDWLARVFFGSHLIADGWHLVHASAVRIDDRAIVIAAPPDGGKSTLAHRACAELGAALMSDDLVFIGGPRDAPLAVGWPTRVAVPAASLTTGPVPTGYPPDALVRTRLHGRERERVVLSPAEHRNLTGFEHAGPTVLGALISVRSRIGVEDASLRSPGQRAAAALTLSGAPVAQRMFMTDMLGLVGGRHLPILGAETIEHWWPDQIPVLPLDINDLAELPSLPIWSQLLAQLPWRRQVKQ